MTEIDIAVVSLAVINFLSAFYTAFCIEASTKHYHWFHELLHRSDLYWYTAWYSCQTIALLVSVTNSFLIYMLGTHLREWTLMLVNRNFGRSSQVDDRVAQKMQEHETVIHGQTFTTVWSSQHYHNQSSRNQNHILPMYNGCPFTASSARRALSRYSQQLRVYTRELTAQKFMSWLASLLVFVAGIAMVWNVAFVPFWITKVGLKREDQVVMIPWNYTK